MRFGAFLAATLISAAAAAQTTHIERPDGTVGGTGRDHFSIYSGETIAPGRDAIAFDLGWPGVSFGYLHGLSDRTDVRLAIDMLYGEENTNYSRFGFGIGAPLRLVLNRNDRITLGVHVDPGLRMYTKDSITDLVMRFPIGGTLALHVLPELDLTVGVDIPFAVYLTHTAHLFLGPMFGFAVEYKVDRNLNVGLNTRFGPLFDTRDGADNPTFGFQTLIGIGYRL